LSSRPIGGSRESTGRRIIHGGPDLSVIVPIYNEENYVVKVVNELLMVLEEFEIDFEVLAVDDGSTDLTAERLKLFRDEPRFSIITHSTNCGKGAAICTGIDHARGTFVVVHDCDGEYGAHNIPYLLEAARRGNFVCFGSRLWRRPRMRWLHFVGNKLISKVASMFLPCDVSDIMTGHKLFRRDLVTRPLGCSGFPIEVELTFMLIRGLPNPVVPFCEVCIDYDCRGSGSKLRKFDGVRSLIQVAREVLR